MSAHQIGGEEPRAGVLGLDCQVKLVQNHDSKQGMIRAYHGKHGIGFALKERHDGAQRFVGSQCGNLSIFVEKLSHLHSGENLAHEFPLMGRRERSAHDLRSVQRLFIGKQECEGANP